MNNVKNPHANQVFLTLILIDLIENFKEDQTTLKTVKKYIYIQSSPNYETVMDPCYASSVTFC